MSLPDFGDAEPKQLRSSADITPEQMVRLRQIGVPLKYDMGVAVKATVNTDDKGEKQIVGVVVGYDIQVRPGGSSCKYLVEFIWSKYGGVEITTIAVAEAAVLPYLPPPAEPKPSSNTF